MANSGVLPKWPSAAPVAGMSVRALERTDLPDAWVDAYVDGIG